MKALLICPNDRPSAAFYTRQTPLALVQLLGTTALDRVLSKLARAGVSEVRILAADRPDEIRDYVDEGQAWGLRAEVVPVSGDLTAEEAKSRYGWSWVANKDHEARLMIEGIDFWPGEDGPPLWESASEWFEIMLAHIDHSGEDAVATREVTPGVWVSSRARVSSRAKLVAPCWIGHNAWIGSDAVVGPRAIVESDACIDEGAEVVNSHIGPATYVGSLIEVRDSLAWGTGLLNWKTGSFVELSDPFLLADLGQQFPSRASSTLFERAMALLAIAVTWPVALYAIMRTAADGQALFIAHRGVKPPVDQRFSLIRTMTWYEMNGVNGMLRRWPQLWSIVRGDFAWVGNRPLTVEQAADLVSDYEHLWLRVPSGLISMADAQGCDEEFGDIARAHAAFYAVHAGRRLDLSVLLRVLRRYIPLTIFPTTPPAIQPLREA